LQILFSCVGIAVYLQIVIIIIYLECFQLRFDEDYDKDVINRIKEIQKESDIISLIADVFEFTKIDRKWMENFIVEIISLIETINYENKKVISKYCNLLFNICGRKFSNVQEI